MQGQPKTIHRLSKDVSEEEALESTRWEPLSNQYKKKLITLMCKVNSNNTPAKITNIFSIAYQCYYLRNSNHFVLPRYKLDIDRNSLRSLKINERQRWILSYLE